MRVHARQGDTVDLLCWRYLGRTTGVVEQVLARNRELAAQGPVLAHGTQVELPDPTPTASATRALLQLWD
jgi:phage tail protein X